MKHEPSTLAVAVFLAFVALTLALSFYFARKTKSAQGYFAAGGSIHWFVNGIAFAGDYLSAASFLGICGMIAFYGYDGFLYSIGYLAGWIVALFVIAEPLKRTGPLHVRRRARQSVPFARHQARRGDQHAGRQRVLSHSANGRRRRADQAAARLPALCRRGDGRRGRGADRRHRRHGLDDVCAVPQRLAAGDLQRDADGDDPEPRPHRRRRLSRQRLGQGGGAGQKANGFRR